MSAYEVNFDGLVGPTHNYAGLSFGNVASQINQSETANPRLAALQGLNKMKTLADMGFRQGVLPPHHRPCTSTLRSLGFQGTDDEVIAKAARQAPRLLAMVSSASAMWVANAATVSPSADTLDGRVHFTPANLNNKLHRAIEAETTSRILQQVFPDPRYFVHHAPLPQHALLGDEGAANHNRLSVEHGLPGVELFVYGTQAGGTPQGPVLYPARQTREASESIMRLHQLDPTTTVFAQQDPAVIDQGVFHNDVIAVSNGPVLFCHQQAFLNQSAVLNELTEKLADKNCQFCPIEVPASLISVADVVQTYLFNSQLLTREDGKMLLVVPQEAREHQSVWDYLSSLVDQGDVIREVKVFDLRESMRNGGGPACLRLRVVLNQAELNATNPNVLLTDSLYHTLTQWVEKHYRDRLAEADLADPLLAEESKTALDELTQIMNLGSVYPFQY